MANIVNDILKSKIILLLSITPSGLFLLVGNQSVLHRVLQNTIYLHTYYTLGGINIV